MGSTGLPKVGAGVGVGVGMGLGLGGDVGEDGTTGYGMDVPGGSVEATPTNVETRPSSL